MKTQLSLYDPGSEEFKEKVRSMFSGIASRYDFINHLFSFNLDQYWRRRAVDELRMRWKNYNPEKEPHQLLDLATGTGDLAFCIARHLEVAITGVDLSAAMIAVANRKLKKINKGRYKISFFTGDAENLCFESASFSAVTIGFGIRNFSVLMHALAEIKRVMRPGAPLIILEFSRPNSKIITGLMSVYNKFLFPFFGCLFSGHPTAYSYLPASVAQFPYGAELAQILIDAGFSKVSFKPLTFGIVTLYSCLRPEQ